VILTGIVSAAAIANGFVGYLNVFFQVPDEVAIIAIVVALGLLSAWGIAESVGVAAIIAVIEIGGLILVLVIGGDSLLELKSRWQDVIPPMTADIWIGIALGAFLAFYAFIGFEDIVNIAEEVKAPTRNLPLAILLSLGISTILYVLVALVAILSLPLDSLINSKTPLADIVVQKSNQSPVIISLISLIAVINGALVQIIMASRVLYGMSRMQSAPRLFAVVNPTTQTPLYSTAVITLAVLVLALGFPLVTLAQVTSFIILLIFALVNLALLKVKFTLARPKEIFCYPIYIPVIGFLLCLGVVTLQIISTLG